VTLATHRLHQHQVVLDNITLTVERGEVLAVLRHEHIARVLPAYGVHAKLTVRQNLVVAQRRSRRPVDLDWVDPVAALMRLHGMLGYRSRDGPDARRARWALAGAIVVRPSLILAAVDGASEGRSSVVLLLGEAGIGKTSVVRAFLDSVSERTHTLVGTCDDLLTPRTFGPLRDAAAQHPGPLADEFANDPD
jgi:ABC-type branched-subunit amino acid transport system ATPase component